MIEQQIDAIQDALKAAELDGWIFTCFQSNDPISLAFLGLNREGKLVTRRCYYLVPRRGTPRKLVHALEPAMLDHLPGEKRQYLTWKEHADGIHSLLREIKRLAAQYSPKNEIPTVSRLDAGTAELFRAEDVELISSADLVQQFAAVWSEEQLAGHRRACAHLHEIVQEAFDLVGQNLNKGEAIDEYIVQRFILHCFEKRGLWTDSVPVVAVNHHSADPHYQPSEEQSAPIGQGDFLLVDLWAKEKRDCSVYADITWCGVCAHRSTDRQEEIFRIVAGARDAAFKLVEDRYPQVAVHGFEVDDASRRVITDAGYGKYFIHRTGHSMDTSDHGQGANMDNLETHDTRRLLPMTGFSIEPGIYLPGEFGVRSEINVVLTMERAEITGGRPQRELIRILA